MALFRRRILGQYAAALFSRPLCFAAESSCDRVQEMPKFFTSHDVVEPLKQVLWASRDVMISGRIWGSKSQRVFALGDGCWLPRT